MNADISSKITLEDYSDNKEVFFMKRSSVKTFIFHMLGILTLGVGYLVAYWYSLDYLIYDSEEYDTAQILMIVTFENEHLLIPFQERDFQLDPFDSSKRERIRYVLFNNRKYYYKPEKMHFSVIETKFGDQFQMTKGLHLDPRSLGGVDQPDTPELTKTYGQNQLLFEIPTIPHMVFVGLMNPISFCLWFLAMICLFANKFIQGATYLTYSFMILIFHIIETQRKANKIKSMNLVEGTYKVFRNRVEEDAMAKTGELKVNNISYREAEVDLNSADVIEEVASDLENDPRNDSDLRNMGSSQGLASGKNKSRLRETHLMSMSRLLKKNKAFVQNEFEEVPITELLPGDLVLIRPGQSVPCDILLVQGSCLVNEALLTGESIPITKSRISNGETLSSVNVLYAGSDCMMLRDSKVVGLVVNTGWNTFKGKIIASLIFNRTIQSKFVQQVIEVCKWLILIFASITLYMIVNDISKGRFETIRTLRYSSDLMANGCQPTTLFMLTVSVVIVAGKLEKRGVTVMHSKKLFHAGRVQTVCFDKTGTLTQNELCVFGITLGVLRNFSRVYRDVGEMEAADPKNESREAKSMDSVKIKVGSLSQEKMPKISAGEDLSEHLLAISRTLSCAQDLHLIKDKLVGDPVDIEMFKTSDCSLEMKEFKEGTFVGDYVQKIRSLTVVKPNKNLLNALNKSEDFGFLILNIFPFCSNKKRMGAVVMDSSQSSFPENEQSDDQSLEGGSTPSDKYFYVCKGAPEKIKEICRKESIPENFRSKLDEYAQKGIRVIALAYKSLESPNLRQEDAETEMEFQGFLLLSNPLQPKTRRTIKNLLFNHVECSMITGDHLFTGINVGYGSGILEEFDSVWVGQFNVSEKRVDWRFFTFEELIKNVHTVKENEDVDMVSNMFHDSRNTSQKKIPSSKQSLKSFRLKGSIKANLANYSKVVSTRGVNTLKQIVSEDIDVDFKIALDGNAMQFLFQKYDADSPEGTFLLKNAKIYGRCKPDQKRLVIEKLKDFKSRKNKCVAFVGDGANDCKALNNADIGLSIGNNDASMASPFITSEESIEKICDTLELGRFTIENFVQLYLCLNGLGVMDVGALFVLLYAGYYYSNWKYLMEYWYYLPMALVICTTSSVGSLNKILPQSLMFNRRVNCFLLAISLAIVLALGSGYWIYTGLPTFKSYSELYSESTMDMEEHFVIDHALLILFYTFCVIAYSMAVQIGYPFKSPVYSNYLYLILGAGLVVTNVIVSNPSAFSNNFSFNYFAVSFARAVDYQGTDFWKWILFCVVSCSAIFLVGRFVMDHFLRKKILKIEEKENRVLGSRVGSRVTSDRVSLQDKLNIQQSYLSRNTRRSFANEEGFSSKIQYEGQSAHDVY